MGLAQIDKTVAFLPLVLDVNQNGIGGATSQTSTVAIRDASTINFYLDWTTGTFMNAGWVLKDAPMTSIGNGIYQRNLPMAATAGITIGLFFVAEYTTTGPVVGIAQEVYQVVNAAAVNADITLLRKQITNRIEEAPGAPGSLVLYDDDSVTPILTWQLRDESGGAVLPAVGTPARRTKAV